MSSSLPKNPSPKNGESPDPQAAGTISLAMALICVALNLRPALSSLAPVLPEVIQTLGIPPAAASLLTMAPVLCLGLFGFVTPRLADRFGTERMVAVALLLTATGIGLRGIPVFFSLLAGTLTAGAGIGIAGVLLPGLVKRGFPRQASLMTGVYTMALCAGAATAAAFTVPLAHWLDSWAAALAFWALPAAGAMLLWLPRVRRPANAGAKRPQRIQGLWGDALAWQVTAFMGLQSSLAYIVFGWLAPILRDRGLDPVTAGFAASVSILVQLAGALAAPVIAARWPSQSIMAVAVVALTLAGLAGSLYAPLDGLWLWMAVLGLGQGGSFAVALSLLVLRAPNAHVASHLSGMAQSVGYTGAAAGPLLAGLLHDWTGGWNATGVLFIVICLLAMIFGFGAGRARTLCPADAPA